MNDAAFYVHCDEHGSYGKHLGSCPQCEPKPDVVERLCEMGIEIAQLKAKLRQYTEAKPVRWEARKSVYGHTFGWSKIYEPEVEEHTNRENYEVRALIVAPKVTKP